MDWNKFTEFGDIPQAGQYGDANRYYDEAGDAVSEQFNRRMEPRLEQAKLETDIRLRNQGLKPGDEAYDYQMTQLDQQQADTRRMSDLEATKFAGSEASRMTGLDLSLGGQQFGEQMQQSGYQTQQRQQQISEELQQRGFSLNEINSILTGQQISMPGSPDFKTASKSETPQYLQAANMGFQSELDQFGAKQAQFQGALQGAGSLAMGFSDRRLKTEIKHLFGKLYSYKLFGHIPQVGVMADENLHAVTTHWSGFKMVNYGAL